MSILGFIWARAKLDRLPQLERQIRNRRGVSDRRSQDVQQRKAPSSPSFASCPVDWAVPGSPSSIGANAGSVAETAGKGDSPLLTMLGDVSKRSADDGRPLRFATEGVYMPGSTSLLGLLPAEPKHKLPHHDGSPGLLMAADNAIQDENDWLTIALSERELDDPYDSTTSSLGDAQPQAGHPIRAGYKSGRKVKGKLASGASSVKSTSFVPGRLSKGEIERQDEQHAAQKVTQDVARRDDQGFDDSAYGSAALSSRGKGITVAKHGDSDTVTEVTSVETLDLPELVRNDLIDRLAEELHSVVLRFADQGPSNPISSEMLGREMLTILKSFSIDMKHDERSHVQRTTVSFVRGQRRKITDAFLSLWEGTRDSEPVAREAEKLIPVVEKMRLLQWDPLQATYPEIASFPPEDIPTEELEGYDSGKSEDEDEPLLTPELISAKEYLINHTAFQWVITTLRRLTDSKLCGFETINRIREFILTSSDLWIRTHHGKSFPAAHFKMRWAVNQFLHTDAYLRNGEHAIAAVVVLCGSEENAQALTCDEYMSMIWGLQGSAFLGQVQRALEVGSGRWIEQAYSQSSISMLYSEEDLHVWVQGSPLSIASVGEQLAWLDAALQSLQSQTGVVVRRAGISSDPMSPLEMEINIIESYEVPASLASAERQDLWQTVAGQPLIKGVLC